MDKSRKYLEIALSRLPLHSVYFARYGGRERPELRAVAYESKSANSCYEIINQYRTFGFSIIDFGEEGVNCRVLNCLIDDLKLGHPFVPQQYKNRRGVYEGSGFNIITTTDCTRDSLTHRAFLTTQSQGLHVDGTFEIIGSIPTSLLACQNPALEGGETVIFNAVSAFVSIAQSTPDLILPFLSNECLIRSDENQAWESVQGPVFVFRNGELISRFSSDNTSYWCFERVEGLRIAFNKVIALAQHGSDYYTRFKLNKGQGVLLANDLVSHGRLEFKDIHGNRRKMIRGLFLRRPNLKS